MKMELGVHLKTVLLFNTIKSREEKRKERLRTNIKYDSCISKIKIILFENVIYLYPVVFQNA